MTYNIDRTFPAKLGDITTITGLTLDTKAITFSDRLLRIFRKIFNGASFDKDYWKLLKKMISNPNDVFGLVAIDGYYTDVMGKDDLGLVFNMGIPKLRGRRIKYLDRTYVRIASGNNLKFYNSLLDDNDGSTHFEFDERNVAWHPHISSGEPCLGSYSNDLARWKNEGNPIMYLKTVHQFLNTWNVRSPFWNINDVRIDHVQGKKAFKSSKMINAFQKTGISHTRQSEKYIIDNVCEINTGSVANDIFCLASIYDKEKMVKNNIIDSFMQTFDTELLSYLRRHYAEHSDRSDNSPHYENSIIARGTRIIIPKKSSHNGIDITQFSSSMINHGGLSNSDSYNAKRIILEGLSRIIYDLYKWMRGTEPIDSLFIDDNFIMSMECQYNFPLMSKNNTYFDEMTLSGLYDHRVHGYTSESSSINPEHYAKKKLLVRRLERRTSRLAFLYVAHYRKKLNTESVENIVNSKLQGFFKYTIDKDNPFTKRSENSSDVEIHYHLHNVGRFWNHMGLYSTQGMFEEVELFIKETECFKDIAALINAFELMKRELVLEEANSLINQYDKVIRRLKDYGHKTSHTEKDTQQIHLSFK